MSNLAETILRDVPIHGRIYTGGNCLDELVLKKDVEAALTAAMDPALTERAGEVLSRLRKADEYEPLGHDGWEAADLITALLAQIAALRANTVQALDEADREYSRKTNDLVERHAEQLAALRAEVRKSAMDAVSAGCQAQEAYEAQKAAEAQIAALTARVEGLTGALDKARTQDRDPDYVYDEEWEYTMRWDEWPDLVDGHDLTEPMPIYTLYKGPTKWVVQIPIDTDGDGETDDFETKLFDSEETARAALSTTDYTLAPHLQKIVDGAKTAPQWDMQADRLVPTDAPHVNETPKSEHDGADVLTDAAQAREAALMEAHKAILAMDTKKDEDLTYNLAVLRAAEKVRRLISEART